MELSIDLVFIMDDNLFLVMRRHHLAAVYLGCLVVALITHRRLRSGYRVRGEEMLHRRQVREEMLHELRTGGKCREIIRMSENAFKLLCQKLEIHGGIRPTQRRQENPGAAKWRGKPILHYHEMLELFAKDRATGARAETAKDRNKRMKDNEHTPETIDEIDHLLETNDISLENFVNGDDIHVVSDTPDTPSSQGKLPSISKGNKRKFEKDDEFTSNLMSSITHVANAIGESTKELCKVMEGSRARVYSEEEIYKELEIMGIASEEKIFNAYLFLVDRPEKARALFGCPLKKMLSMLDRIVRA